MKGPAVGGLSFFYDLCAFYLGKWGLRPVLCFMRGQEQSKGVASGHGSGWQDKTFLDLYTHHHSKSAGCHRALSLGLSLFLLFS